MLLSINTGPAEKKFGLFRTVDIFANAGFDAVDLSLYHSMKDEECGFYKENYLKYAEQFKSYVEECGMAVNQAHAYFPTSFNEPEMTQSAFERVVRGMEIAAYCGAKNIIVHPNQHLKYVTYGNPEKLMEINREFYGKLIPFAEKFGINIAVENMFQWKEAARTALGHCIDSTCSSVKEFKEYVDMMHSERVVACVDVGHCGLVGRDPAEMIRVLGSRVKALHIHDNDSRLDNHTVPFAPGIGTVKWDEVCKALAEIGYDGDFTFETDGCFESCNEDTVSSIACHIHDVGRYLCEKIEEYKY